MNLDLAPLLKDRVTLPRLQRDGVRALIIREDDGSFSAVFGAPDAVVAGDLVLATSGHYSGTSFLVRQVAPYDGHSEAVVLSGGTAVTFGVGAAGVEGTAALAPAAHFRFTGTGTVQGHTLTLFFVPHTPGQRPSLGVQVDWQGARYAVSAIEALPAEPGGTTPLLITVGR